MLRFIASLSRMKKRGRRKVGFALARGTWLAFERRSKCAGMNESFRALRCRTIRCTRYRPQSVSAEFNGLPAAGAGEVFHSAAEGAGVWQPISEDELHSLIATAEAAMDPAALALWERVRIPPVKW